MKILILCGGEGLRLWPLSTQEKPKPFLSLFGKESLLQSTVSRLQTITQDIFLLCASSHLPLVKEYLPTFPQNRVITEPEARNTLPAIAYALKYLEEKEGVKQDELIFIAPSDHLIEPIDRFCSDVESAKEIAKKGFIVTFGVQPTRPETGFGYILKGHECEVKAFIEKPNEETAKRYLESGDYLWNTGMFLFQAGKMKSEIERFIPQARDFFVAPWHDINSLFLHLPKTSLDYAVIEKSTSVAVKTMDVSWSDLGSFEQIYDLFTKEQDMLCQGSIDHFNSKSSLVVANTRPIVTIGIEDLIIIDTTHALFVARRGESQKIKELLNVIPKAS